MGKVVGRDCDCWDLKAVAEAAAVFRAAAAAGLEANAAASGRLHRQL